MSKVILEGLSDQIVIDKIAGKLIERRKREKKQYSGGRAPRQTRQPKTTAGALFQLAKLR